MVNNKKYKTKFILENTPVNKHSGVTFKTPAIDKARVTIRFLEAGVEIAPQIKFTKIYEGSPFINYIQEIILKYKKKIKFIFKGVDDCPSIHLNFKFKNKNLDLDFLVWIENKEVK